jgi:hypothetical protein
MNQTKRLVINEAIVGCLTKLSSLYTATREAARGARTAQLKRDWDERYQLYGESKEFIQGYFKTARPT